MDAALQVAADAVAAELQRQAPVVAQPEGPVRMVPLADLAVRPERYQFRVSCIGRSGTDERLRDCSSFRRELAGVVLVWREPEGRLALLDGHHRYQLARRSGVDDLAVLEVQASSARDARVIGALANLAAGHATAIDAARLMRDEGMGADQLAEHGISRRSRLISTAAQLLPLEDGLFSLACTGEMELSMALALAAAGPPVVQRDLHAEATRRRWSADQVTEAARLARLATVTTSSPDGCLPGLGALLQQSSSNLSELLAVRAAIRRQLAGELRALATVSKRRSARALEALEVAVIDADAAAAARDNGRAQQRLFDRLAGLSGGLQDVIVRLAALVDDQHPAGDVVSDHLAEIRAAIDRELSG